MSVRSKTYLNRVKRYQTLFNRLDKKNKFLSLIRGVAFIVFAATAYTANRDGIDNYYFFSLIPLVIFIVCAVIHGKTFNLISKLKLLIDINNESYKRTANTWNDFSNTGKQFEEESSVLSDLNIIGDNSLFQMIQATSSHAGARTLLSWLSNQPTNAAAIYQRQEAVKELCNKLSWRQHFLMEGRLQGKLRDTTVFLKWLKSPSLLTQNKWLVISQRMLVTSTAILAVCSTFFTMPSFWLVGLSLQLILFLITINKCRHHYSGAVSNDSAFLVYKNMCELLEDQHFSSDYLKKLQSKLHIKNQKISSLMHELAQINRSLRCCYSSVYPFVNILFLWDIHFLYKLEKWKDSFGSNIAECFKILGEAEAISSLAGFGFDNPDYTFATINSNGTPLTATSMGHPLISRSTRICNSFSIDKQSSLALITGSNMSGKSSFLRCIGINTILAFSGAPVAAASFNVTMCKITTSIQIIDSISMHVSHFYAEVKSIKSILDETTKQKPSKGLPVLYLPVLYLIDELFSGTNTKERLIASKMVISKLLNSQSFGLVTTHDLDLVLLKDKFQNLKNHHFCDDIDENGNMHFGYKIKKGPVSSTNALQILRNEGIFDDE